MRISIMTALALLCLTLAAGTAWAYSASVHIYITNDDNEAHYVFIEYSSGDTEEDLDAGEQRLHGESRDLWPHLSDRVDHLPVNCSSSFSIYHPPVNSLSGVFRGKNEGCPTLQTIYNFIR